MFDPAQLELAVAISRYAYRLLRALERKFDRGLLHVEAVEDYTSKLELTRAWMEDRWELLPVEGKPEREQLPQLAGFFSTYLDSSHVVNERAKLRSQHSSGRCLCDVCITLMTQRHIEPLKLSSGDRHTATELERSALEQLASELGASKEVVESIMEDAAVREERALLAYGLELFVRLEGESSGPANLALWRRFAWKREGSSKKGFEFSAGMILAAEARIAKTMRD